MNKTKRGYTSMVNEMSEAERLEELSYLFNRSTSQLKEHFQLVDTDKLFMVSKTPKMVYDKLFELENKMRTNHLSYGCGDLEDVREVFRKSYGTSGWNYNHYYLDPFTKAMVFLAYQADEKVEQVLLDRYQGPKDKEFFYNYLWNDYVKENWETLSKFEMVDSDLLKSTLL